MYHVPELNTHVLYTFRTAGAWSIVVCTFYIPFAPLVLLSEKCGLFSHTHPEHLISILPLSPSSSYLPSFHSSILPSFHPSTLHPSTFPSSSYLPSFPSSSSLPSFHPSPLILKILVQTSYQEFYTPHPTKHFTLLTV